LLDAGFVADERQLDWILEPEKILQAKIYRKEANSPIAAALMTMAHAHPSNFIPFELAQWPITFLSLVSRTTMTTKGGANRPFRMADQNSIFTALILE
jgi:hypothetical protein